MFPSYYNMTEEKLLKKNEINVMQCVIKTHLSKLKNKLLKYFPPSHDIRLNNMWILNPFLPCEKHELSLLNESQLLELSSDKSLEQSFNTKNLIQFWISLSNEYPNLYEEALKKLVPFATTYLCESGFSTLTTIKTKSRNKLDVEPTMRISLTNSIEAQIDSLVKQHQDQGSH